METKSTKAIEVTRTDNDNELFHIYEVRTIRKNRKNSQVLMRYLDEKTAEECAEFVCENMQKYYKTAFVIPVTVFTR